MIGPVWQNIVVRRCVYCRFITEARGLTFCPRCGYNGYPKETSETSPENDPPVVQDLGAQVGDNKPEVS